MWPFLGMMALSGWQFFMLSYRMNEAAQQETGLNAIYLVKSSLMFFVIVVTLQGFSIIARSLATILAPQSVQPATDTKPVEIV
jgi:TRAP-type mannitol/chloroaromatic compound transport system permease small subunit